MYPIVTTNNADKSLLSYPPDVRRHIVDVVKKCLGEFLWIPTPQCNKKSIKGSKRGIFRLHVSMKYTVFYFVDEAEKRVVIVSVMGINQAHSKYGIV